MLERKGHTAVANRQRLGIVVMRNGDVVPRYVGILPIAPEPKQFSLSDTADEMLQDMIETFLDRAVK